MSRSVRRVRAQFSTIQITMISIVVALALQELLDRLPTIDALWQPSSIAVRLWCQVLVAFAIIVKMWVGFVLGAASTERVPRVSDLLGPMGILVFVDAQIASIDVEHALRWFYILGVGQLAAAAFIAGQQMAFGDARRDAASTGQRAALVDPATAEAWIGVCALVAALADQTIEFGDWGLLVGCAFLLIIEVASAAGPIVGWRMLRRREEQLRLDEADDYAQPS